LFTFTLWCQEIIRYTGYLLLIIQVNITFTFGTLVPIIQETKMDYDSSSKFISSLAKFLQSLCNGYVEFDNGVQVIGHIYLSVDTGKTIDYVLNEKVCKTDENSVTFISNSFHAQPAEKPKPEAVVQKKDSEQSDNSSSEQLEPKSTNIGTIQNSRGGSSQIPNVGKRPHSPSGRKSPNRSKKSRADSFVEGAPQHPNNNLSSVPNPAGAVSQDSFTDSSYPSTFFSPDEEDNSGGGSDRDIKPSLDTDVTFIKEEYAASGDPPPGQDTNRAETEDPSMFQSLFPSNPSYAGAYPNQNNYPPHSSQRPGPGMFPPGQMGSQLEPGENPVDPSGCISFLQETYPKKQQHKKDIFICEHCSRTFSYKRCLSRHKWKCEGTRMLDCQICHRVFYRTDQLKAHMAVCQN